MTTNRIPDREPVASPVTKSMHEYWTVSCRRLGSGCAGAVCSYRSFDLDLDSDRRSRLALPHQRRFRAGDNVLRARRTRLLVVVGVRAACDPGRRRAGGGEPQFAETNLRAAADTFPKRRERIERT